MTEKGTVIFDIITSAQIHRAYRLNTMEINVHGILNFEAKHILCSK